MALEDNRANQPKVRFFAKDTVVCKEGVPDGGEMYVILKGSAGEYTDYDKPGELLKRSLDVGAFFGEMSLFLEKPRESTLVMLADSVLLQIGHESVNEFLKNDVRVVYELIKSLCAALYEFTGKGDQAGSAAASDGVSVGDLFPDGHGRYVLPKPDPPAGMIYEKTYECPVCGKSLKSKNIRPSKLVQDRMDNDLRVVYKDIEPLYYDVITCPNCFFSALAEGFANKLNTVEKARLQELTMPLGSALKLDPSNRGDAKTVFATYFIAMRCLPIYTISSELTQAKLWMKVSRLYDDCEDSAMSDFAAKKAMELYFHAYMNSDIPVNQVVQLEYLLGVLSFRFGDLGGARKLLFQVKTNPTVTQVMRRMAEDRIDDIKEAKGQ